VVATVGGAVLGLVPVDQRRGFGARALRAAITAVGGFELCRVAVREALIGRRTASGAGLREVLARVALERARAPEADERDEHRLRLEAPTGVDPAPGWLEAAAGLCAGADGLLLARHGPDPGDGVLGTSASRAASLPGEAVGDLLAAAQAVGEPVVGGGPGPHRAVRYSPELLWRPARLRRAGAGALTRVRERATRSRAGSRSEAAIASAPGRRHRFEALFAGREDPWRYTNEYERTKYGLTLSLVPEERPATALEVGCAEGHFTKLLAPRVGRLTATDISAIAVERARRRCQSEDNVEFAQLDLVDDPLPGRFDLVVCSETLYFTGDRARLDAAAQKLAGAVLPGGHLITANAHQVVDDPGSPGFDWGLPFGAKVIGEALAATGALSLIRELRTPLYRVQMFRRTDGSGALAPELVELEQPAPVPDHVADTVRWGGGAPAAGQRGEEASTDQLPILVYHHVAPGAEAGSQFHIAPEAFAEQLAYLRSAGFRSVDLEEWRGAMAVHRPLPGMGVMITFDDGYRSFAEYAWPLLRRYGFGAMVFVVTGEVGGWNRWDEGRRDQAELMDWDELGALHAEGVELGAHSETHPRMTELTPGQIVRESARSRVAMTRRIGIAPVAFAYPYGLTDGVVQHLVGACGYRYGLSVRGACCRLHDRLLAMPRIEVSGEDDLPAFIAKLSG
jgi:peptidoglycan/xylan/chitin deacetylase (PgdA/CDA1 family)/SAM-dependent methyltransferase